jgi:peptide deformylase
MRELRYYGDPILRKPASSVEIFDEELQGFAEELIQCMYEYDGVGLAAPQIGVSKQMAAIDVWGGEKPPLVLVNPRITWSSPELISSTEGCLSIPDISGPVERAEYISVSAKTPDGADVFFERAERLFSQALQHEIDHLRGVLFVDHIRGTKKALIRNKLRKMARSTQKSLK